MGSGFSPLAEELAVLPGPLALRHQRPLVPWARGLPFRPASQGLAELLLVPVSPETARRRCEEVGSRVEEQQRAEATLPWKEEANEREDPRRLASSADGAMVPVSGGAWAAVRTRAIGAVPADPADLEQVQVRTRAYFSRWPAAIHFIALAEAAPPRRKLVQAKAVGAVMDGAAGRHTRVDIHRQAAVRMLDCPHAPEPLSQVVEALRASRHVFPPDRLHRGCPLRTQRGPPALLRLADRLTEDEINREEVRAHWRYLRTRLAVLQEPRLRQAGWPSGSGMVERANQLVVETRLKGSGRRWERRTGTPMLAVRNGGCNARWQAPWQTACQQRHRARALRRHERAIRRHQVRQAALKPAPLSPPPPALLPVPLVPPEPPAMSAGSSRPSPHPPWKRGPSCAPSRFAKI